MKIEREKFLDTVADSFSAYYDLHMAEGEQELPLVFRADYYSRAERYWLTKNIPIWGNETNEYAYVFSAPAFDRALAARCIDYALEEALPLLDARLSGFAQEDAVLTAPETRSSSPVRILRDETRQSALRGLYPAGEGAGYAGGIMSAAIDGILTAEALLKAQERL